MKKLLFIFALLAATAAYGQTGTNMKYESANFIIGKDNPVIDVKPGLKRQILGYNDGIMLVKVFFGKEMEGKRPPLHTHPHTQSSYIISGKFEMHAGDKVQILGAGDAYYVEPNVPHEAYCIEEGIIIDGFSPIREDFLKK